MKNNKTQELYLRAKKIIPGGTQLLSKRPEIYAPGVWPAYYSKTKGCEVWDLDGKHYYDFTSNGISACLLGFANPAINKAVIKAVNNGVMSTLNPPEQVELAERLLDIHPWAKQARFARTGGESMTVAVRIARASTGRSKVAVAGYHGWHDWYLAANLGDSEAQRGQTLPGLPPAGVPSELRGTAFAFKHDDFEDFDNIMDRHGKELAAVVMEPSRFTVPQKGYLEHVKKRCKEYGVLLIFDEITIGWRLCFGGSHLKLGTNPDIAVFSKTLGNGHPIAAVIGTEAAMQGANESFISSTYWTEKVGPVAALATLSEMRKTDVCGHVNRIGKKYQEIMQLVCEQHQLQISVTPGHSCLPRLSFYGENGKSIKTLYTQLMLAEGVLAGGAFSPTLAHSETLIEQHGNTANSVFNKLERIIQNDNVDQLLKNSVIQTGFKRLVD